MLIEQVLSAYSMLFKSDNCGIQHAAPRRGCCVIFHQVIIYHDVLFRNLQTAKANNVFYEAE